jgi:hypothetical protein
MTGWTETSAAFDVVDDDVDRKAEDMRSEHPVDPIAHLLQRRPVTHDHMNHHPLGGDPDTDHPPPRQIGRDLTELATGKAPDIAAAQNSRRDGVRVRDARHRRGSRMPGGRCRCGNRAHLSRGRTHDEEESSSEVSVGR